MLCVNSSDLLLVTEEDEFKQCTMSKMPSMICYHKKIKTKKVDEHKKKMAQKNRASEKIYMGGSECGRDIHFQAGQMKTSHAWFPCGMREYTHYMTRNGRNICL